MSINVELLKRNEENAERLKELGENNGLLILAQEDEGNPFLNPSTISEAKTIYIESKPHNDMVEIINALEALMNPDEEYDAKLMHDTFDRIKAQFGGLFTDIIFIAKEIIRNNDFNGFAAYTSFISNLTAKEMNEAVAIAKRQIEEDQVKNNIELEATWAPYDKDRVMCSHCNRVVSDVDTMPYCDMCGAKMTNPNVALSQTEPADEIMNENSDSVGENNETTEE